jgi:phosphate transport system substrate-binding protein
VQASNPIKGLTLQDVANIYSRKMTKWPNGDQIRLILRPQNDAYSKYMDTINPEIAAASETSHTIPGVFVVNTDQDAVVQIEKTQGSFGVSSCMYRCSGKEKS